MPLAGLAAGGQSASCFPTRVGGKAWRFAFAALRQAWQLLHSLPFVLFVGFGREEGEL